MSIVYYNYVQNGYLLIFIKLAMIKTSTGATINCDSLSEQLNDKLIQQISFNSDFLVNCYQKEDWLIILINPQPTEDNQIIIDLIKDIIDENQIINDLVIANNTDHNEVYFASNYNYPDNLLKNLSQNEVSQKKYSSGNFSSGLIIFIFSILSIVSIGIIYYFSRPCVIGKCDLIPITNASVSGLLKTKSDENLTESEIEDFNVELTKAIQALKRIPRWSKYHQEATQLINTYQEKLIDLNHFLAAFNLANNAENMSQDLPLSLDEWTRVKTFWQDAIAKLNLISNANFQEAKQQKINNYQTIISEVEQKIETEKVAQEKLTQAENIVNQIQKDESAISSLSDLEKLETQWQRAITEIESIPQDTVSAKNKDNLLNSYLTNISNLQTKLKAEKEATSLLSLAQENIKLAEESQNNNQWTKAVNLWQKALESLEKIPLDSLITEDVISLKTTTQEKLELAKISLKEAVKREQIKLELKTICSSTEDICTYNVSNEKIQIFLTKEYFEKVASLYKIDNSNTNSNKKEQLLQHIEQVENNYQYLSNKYKLPVEVYNYNKDIIMIYNYI